MFRPFFRYFPACLLLLTGVPTAVGTQAAPATAATGSKSTPVAAPQKSSSPRDTLRIPVRRDTLRIARPDSLRLLDSLRIVRTADSLRLVRDSVRADSVRADSLRTASYLRQAPPDSTYRWPRAAATVSCADPLESLAQCWRLSPRWALQETGFPGMRAGGLDLRDLEPMRVTGFYQGTPEPTPYRTGGQLPFRRYQENAGLEEVWAPVQPLDTPTTDLHWMRGALFLNQFTLRMERMVGNRAYLGLEYHSDGAESQFYEYAFQVHQPYLGALGRDSASLVIHDSSNAISARHIRPRLGFWLGARTVIEVYADFLNNGTSLTNPTSPASNDSLQRLYDASFSASTFGAIAAHNGETYQTAAVFRHASWQRGFSPQGTTRVENASGMTDFARLEWTLPKLPGAPRLRLEAENHFTNDAFWTGPVGTAIAPDEQARDDKEQISVEARPALGPLDLVLRGDGARRMRADGLVEWLGGADGEATLDLPWGFSLGGGAGRQREGAPNDLLFRLQPALGLYPNAALQPRTVTRARAGAAWESRYLGFGAEWNRNRFENTWLPRTLPAPFSGSLPDSISLRYANYPEESRDLAQLSAYVGLGNWKLSLWQNYLIKNEVRDNDTATGPQSNALLPRHVFKGQLLWKRRVLDDKLGLQTQWDWEWFSERYAFASDMDGTSRTIKLDEYLALDFTVRMEIRTFLFYFRAMNLNHDRYATEPGVHPPGINFRFGVDWRIRN